MNIGWGGLTLPSVGIDRMLHAYKVRRPVTVHQQNLTISHGERGRDSKLGALLLKDSRTTPGTNSNGEPRPRGAQLGTPTSLASQAGSWGPSLPASRPFNQSPKTWCWACNKLTKPCRPWRRCLIRPQLLVVRNGTTTYNESRRHVRTSRALTQLGPPSVRFFFLFYY